MGNKASSSLDHDKKEANKSKTKLSKTSKVYAELVLSQNRKIGGNGSDEENPIGSIRQNQNDPKAPLVPIKVLLNAQIASSAIDSMKDSQILVNELAKSMLLEVLKDDHSSQKFGELLKHILSYQPTRYSTRSLIYWTLRSDPIIQTSSSQSVWWIHYWSHTTGINEVSLITTNWLLHPLTQKNNIVPLLDWTLNQHPITIKPLAHLIEWSLPFSKPATVSGIKQHIRDSLQSPEVKAVVKEGLLHFLQVVGNNSKSSMENNSSDHTISSSNIE
eukprot:gene9578-12901_t